MADDVTARILADYPMFAFLVNDPEIGPLLVQAVDPNGGLSPAAFQAKLQQTQWWQQHGEKARQWQVLQNTDPATAAQQTAERANQIRQFAIQQGVTFSDDQINGAATTSLALGVDPNSATFRSWLGTWAFQTPGSTAPTVNKLRQIATGEYMLPVDDNTLAGYAASIASGTQTEQGFRTIMAQQAQGRFPGLSQAIAAGVTPGQYFSPYKATIAKELELPSADSVDLLNDPRWAQVTGIADGKGSVRPMNLSETIGLARSQSEWKFTSGANSMASDLATKVLQDFGATK